MSRFLSSSHLFTAALLALFAYLVYAWTPIHNGDVAEYTLTTVAFANHGTPGIRLSDLEEGQRRLPELAYSYSEIDSDLKHQPGILHLPFAKGRHGQIYTIHFFAYSALAAIPYKLLPLVGIDPFKCYLALNLSFVVLLGVTLRQVLGNSIKAAFALGLFLTGGIWAYLRWTSPEVMSAAALLSALLLFCTGASLRAAFLTAIGALQNPSIILTFAFLPLTRLVWCYQPQQSWRARLIDAVMGWRGVAALLSGALVALMAPLWNLMHFGVPSLIAQTSTSLDFVSWVRLHSIFFDLSQGMLIGVPALVALLMLWSCHHVAHRNWAVLALSLALMLVLVLPALPVMNWNSGAQGIMRYAVWAAMPLLFALVWQLRERKSWLWLAPAIITLSLQIMVTSALGSFRYVEFSPWAEGVMIHAPSLYNPEPELFAERIRQRDEYFHEDEIYTFSKAGTVYKTMYHSTNVKAAVQLCGEHATLAKDNNIVATVRGWRYINGSIRCKKS